MKRGNFTEAHERLSESLRLERSPGTLINLAVCAEKLGKLNDSLRHLREALELGDADERRHALVTKLVAAIAPRVPRLILDLDGDARTFEVVLDGDRRELTAGRHELLVNPGDHEIIVREPGGGSQRFEARVDEGASHRVTFHAPSRVPPSAPSQAPSVESPPRAAREEPRLRESIESRPVPIASSAARVGAIVLGAGGVGLVAGAVTGFMALGRKVDVDHHCGPTGCDAQGREASEEGKALATASTVATTAGLLGVAMGSYLLLREKEPATSRHDVPPAIAYGAAGVGVVGLVTSALAASAALSAERERQDKCDAFGCRDQDGIDATSRGRAYSTVSTVAFAAGLAGVGVASYSLLFRPLFKKAPDGQFGLSPAGVSCRLSF